MPNDYATLAEFKASMPNLTATFADGSQDANLTELLTDASRDIDRETNRPPGSYYVSADDTRYFDGPDCPSQSMAVVQGGLPQDSIAWLNRMGGGGTSYRSLWIDELCAAPTTVSVAQTGDITNFTVWASTSYFTWPYNALSLGRPFIRLDLDILYGGQYLWYSFPRCIKIVGKFGFAAAIPGEIKRATIIQAGMWYRRQVQGYQGKSSQVGKAKAFSGSALDPDVDRLIRLFRRQPI